MSIERTKIVLRESAHGLLYKALAIVVSFLMMPVMLTQLGSDVLGAWLVLLSVFQWVTFFDLGVAAGAKNEIARASAAGSKISMRSAITTGWFYTIVVTFCLALIFIVLLSATPILQWLRIKVFPGININFAIWVVSIGACIAFAFNYIQSVYAADQKSSAISKFSFLTNALFLMAILISPSDYQSGLHKMSVFYLLSLMIANGWLIVKYFYKKPELIPNIKYVDKKLKKNILGFGLKLFVIQLAALILFTADRLMVSIFVGSSEVVVFDAAFKIFSMVTMIHGLLMTALWSAFTHAKAQNDWLWIHKTLSRLILFMLPIALGCFLLAYLSPLIIKYWLTSEQVGPNAFYWLFALVTLLICWSNIFANFLNGIGNTKVQLYTAIAAAILNIPLSYIFSVLLDYGVSGVVMGTIGSLLIFSLAGPLQVFKILKFEMRVI